MELTCFELVAEGCQQGPHPLLITAGQLDQQTLQLPGRTLLQQGLKVWQVLLLLRGEISRV